MYVLKGKGGMLRDINECSSVFVYPFMVFKGYKNVDVTLLLHFHDIVG